MASARTAAGTSHKPQPAKNTNQSGSVFSDRVTELGGEKKINDEELQDDGNVNRVFKIAFKPYIEPKDRHDMKETKIVHAENMRRYEFNRSQVPTINILLRRMRFPPYKLPRPPDYYEDAKRHWQDMLEDETFSALQAVGFLADRGRYPKKDYRFEDAIKEANEMCLLEFLDRMRQEFMKTKQYINVKDIVPQQHARVCDCNFQWDGFSTTCRGSKQAKRQRLRWRTRDNHHFMQPSFEPICY